MVTRALEARRWDRESDAASRAVFVAALRGSRGVARRALWRIILWYTRGRVPRLDASLVRAAIRHYARVHDIDLDEEELKMQMRRIMKMVRR